MQEHSVQRPSALYHDQVIGIESIYTVINGKQINIPGKVESLREKRRNGELLCTCGCNTKLVLVAGDRNLRQQHFKIKEAQEKSICNLVTEGQGSIDDDCCTLVTLVMS